MNRCIKSFSSSCRTCYPIKKRRLENPLWMDLCLLKVSLLEITTNYYVSVVHSKSKSMLLHYMIETPAAEFPRKKSSIQIHFVPQSAVRFSEETMRRRLLEDCCSIESE
mmetsp:Transcript_14585/g.20850  ORF Transcript_14585/g.20850 Transcript_14585/m.20850 type:complete len:109 (+) Transcript_14585:166-492(+)